MKPGAIRALLALAALPLSTAAPALDWPIASPRLAATFGTPVVGGMATGLLLASEGGAVLAAGAGELVFAVEEGGHPAGLPTALGSFAVYEHADGLAAVYAHLAPDPLARRPREARPGVILGAAGESGWIDGEGILLQVFDRTRAAWINPLLLLPPLPDRDPPVIRSAAVSRAGKTWVLGEAKSIGQGRYSIAIDAFDRADAPWFAGPSAPYSLRVSVDGVEVARQVFDVAKGSGGQIFFFSQAPRPLSELRTPEGRYSIAERLFAQGRSTVEAIAEDAAGNRRTASWTVLVE